MENREVIRLKKGSTVELPKGWFKKHAPLEFFEIRDDLDVDTEKHDPILTEMQLKRIKARLETIEKNINRFPQDITYAKFNAFCEATVRLHYMVLRLKSVAGRLEEVMRNFNEARESIINANNCHCLKERRFNLRMAFSSLECAKFDFDDAKYTFRTAKELFSLKSEHFDEARNDSKEIEYLLIDVQEYISQKIETIKKEIQRQSAFLKKQLDKKA